MEKIIIAIDGPAGAGKSSIAKKIASELGIEYIDTGAMYRAVTLKLIRLKCSFNDITRISKILNVTEIDFLNDTIYLDGEIVNAKIRTSEVNSSVSAVSAIPTVRKKLVAFQRQIGKSKSIIMDGRDIGTNVFPDANYKFYLTASLEERTLRRWLEIREKGFNESRQEVRKEIERRDQADMARELNPLCKSDDAIVIDTTGKDMDRVVKEMLIHLNINK